MRDTARGRPLVLSVGADPAIALPPAPRRISRAGGYLKGTIAGRVIIELGLEVALLPGRDIRADTERLDTGADDTLLRVKVGQE